jgi:segregation and condensation protein B
LATGDERLEVPEEVSDALDAAADEAAELAGVDEEPPAEIGEAAAEQAPLELTPELVRAALEAVLFVSERPLTLDQLAHALKVSRDDAAAALESLRAKYGDGSGVRIAEVAGALQLRTAPEAGAAVRRFLQVKPQRLTRAALETLAIVAYRQPVTRLEVEDIRGVDCGAVLKALLDRRLLRILGKKEEPGRPLLYGTTREFLELFSLRDLTGLPTLREFQELTEEHKEIVETEAPPASAPLAAEPADEHAPPAPEHDEALDALEFAMKEAEARTKTAQEILNPPGPEAPAEGAPAPGAGTPEQTG